jgi:hypothetical protein
MRTKTLLVAAAVCAAGAASAMAQTTVFSVNAVGYVKVDVASGFQLISNPLNAADNSVGALIPNPPNGTTIFKYNTSRTPPGFDSTQFLFGSWGNPALTIAPGEGVFIQSGSAHTITFVGEVKQGSLTQNVPRGFSIQASQVPQTGKIQTELNYQPSNGDTVFQYHPERTPPGYVSTQFLFGQWGGGAPGDEPVIRVGEAFFVDSAAAKTWDRQFSVNTP